MIKFYTNKELARKFEINLAKWKRWSREFLPPDPLGGLQSGYARQYNPDQAFSVYLGGHLVADLKFSIPEARQILHDLHQWLASHNFYFDYSGIGEASQKPAHAAKNYQIAIINRDPLNAEDSDFLCLARGVIEDELLDFQGIRIRRECYHEWPIGLPDKKPPKKQDESYRVLNISALHRTFLRALASR